MRVERVELWTDGSGLATGGPGGWAFVLRGLTLAGEVVSEREGYGGLPETTNQRAEMTAVVWGLAALTRPVEVTVVTDSEYVMHGFTKGWVARWQDNGWLNREGERVKNRDLWEELAAHVAAQRHVSWRHVKGHQAERRCGCGWSGGLRIRRCPDCGEPTTRHDLFPLNARCDELAGAERRRLIEKSQKAAA